MNNEQDQDYKCPICLEDFNQLECAIEYLPCHHHVCFDCNGKIIKTNQFSNGIRCPLCRESVIHTVSFRIIIASRVKTSTRGVKSTILFFQNRKYMRENQWNYISETTRRPRQRSEQNWFMKTILYMFGMCFGPCFPFLNGHEFVMDGERIHNISRN